MLILIKQCMRILAIETSCDETAVAILECIGDPRTNGVRFRVLSNIIHSQAALHAEYGGAVASDGSDDAEGLEARHRLQQCTPEILFVAFGHPKQEQWIEKHLQEFPSVQAVIGIGGTLDYWAGI